MARTKTIATRTNTTVSNDPTATATEQPKRTKVTTTTVPAVSPAASSVDAIAISYILEHLADKAGNKRLEVKKTAKAVTICIVAAIKDDSKQVNRARFSIKSSADAIGMKWNAETLRYEGISRAAWDAAESLIKSLPSTTASSQSTATSGGSARVSGGSAAEQKKPAKKQTPATPTSSEPTITLAQAKARAKAMLDAFFGTDSKLITEEQKQRVLDQAFKIAQ